jgi:prepilin-type N-terminal cleavage/methylation domain-containing protein
MKARADSGFTLLEVLIALGLLGMLTVLAYGAVQFGNLSWRHTRHKRDADADRAAIRQVLGHSIETAYPAFRSTDYADRRIAFDGEPASVQLIAPLPEALTPGVMAVERFALTQDGEGSSLVMSWHLDLPAAKGGAMPTQTTRIAAPLSALRFSYFGHVKDGDAAAWFEQWRDMDHLPELVHVQAWRQGNTGPAWLDFVVAPTTTTPTDCVYDLEGPICRRRE